MPIEVHADLRRPSPDEFAALAYDVMACAFQVHNEMGRFMEEMVYKQLIARRFGGVELEVPVLVSWDGFEKRYWLDMLVRGTALFEWKAVETLAAEHRAQLLNYLLLCDLPKGKLANLRPERIEHEFVNTSLRPEDRHRFVIEDSQFNPLDDADQAWKQFLVAALRDWGAGLDVNLYDAAICHVLGGPEKVCQRIDIVVGGHKVGAQNVRVTPSNATWKVTALAESDFDFESHLRRFLSHTTLDAVHWVNVNRRQVLFKTLLPNPSRSAELDPNHAL